ncbi:MAG TPA: hypothetical protein GXX77_08315 [Candidatus Cloacimonetes bacterium]|nr:hypothetical protein [Candidatus Cloacimonadota bacterium]
MNNNKETNKVFFDVNYGIDLLSDNQIQTFQSSLMEFMNTFEADSPEMKKSLEEIAELLTVTDENFEQIAKQKWFQRAWYTVSGKNKKLAKISKHNLTKVQRLSLVFLENIGKQNNSLMRSVHFALNKVEKLRVQNLKVKDHLIQFVDKLNESMGSIKDKVDNHEEEISMIKKSGNNIIHIIVGVFLLIIVVILFLTTSSSFLTTVIIAVLGLGGIFSLVSGLTITYKTKSDTIIQQKLIHDTELQIKNRKQLPIMLDNLAKFLTQIISYDLVYEPILPILQCYDTLLGPEQEEDIEPELDSKAFAEELDRVFQMNINIAKEIHDRILFFVEKYSELINETMSGMIDEYLPDSAGLQLKYEINDKQQTIFHKEIVGYINPCLEQLYRMQEQKESLNARYPRFRKKVVENPVWAGVKAFAKGFFIIPAIFDDSESFLIQFDSDFKRYLAEWDSLFQNVSSSLIPALKQRSEYYAKECVNRYEPMFKEFDVHNIDLFDINQEIIEEMETFEREMNK